MTTIANRKSESGSHWYFPDGRACYEVPYADPRKGNRPTTLADARKLALVPSVTTILKCLHKQALVDWLIEQAVLAVLTTPRNQGEELDAFIQRVLHDEKVQDQESQLARDRGTEIHDALENAFAGTFPDPELWSWCEPAFSAISKRGRPIGTETIVVGDGYAGKVDLIQETEHEVWIWDWKTSKKLPKGEAWTEHQLQLAAYAAAWARGDKPIRTGNIYISTQSPGEFVICEHGDWGATFAEGFLPVLRVWQFMNNFRP